MKDHPVLQAMLCQCDHRASSHLEEGGLFGGCAECDCEQLGVSIENFKKATGIDPRMGQVVGKVNADGEVELVSETEN